MFWKNDWLSYHYNDSVDLKYKSTSDAVWKLNIKKTIDRPVKSYYEELLLNAQTIRDSFSEPFDLLLSGGVDSEVVLKCHLDLKIPINVFVFKYKNDINKPDFHEALKTCDIYGIKPKIIDFDLKTFIENDAYDIWKTGYFNSPGNLVNMKFIEYLDNIPIICDGINADNFVLSKKSSKISIYERHFSMSSYSNIIGRTVISAWYDYSPELVLSFLNLNLHKWKKHKLISPPFDYLTLHKLKYINFNRTVGTRIRKKRIGWEKNDDITQEHSFMYEFHKKYIDNKNIKLIEHTYDYDSFKNML
jgi:hypothetical protein